MLKTLFCHQCLQDLGLENFFSHYYLYQKTFQIIFFYFQNLGATLTLDHPGQIAPSAPPSDRPYQLIIFPIGKSLHEFFFSNFFGARIFFFCFPCSIFIFASPNPPPPPPPPIIFLMVRTLITTSCKIICG